MKKALVTVFLVLLILGSAYSKDFKIFLNGLDQHPEMLGGFLPTGSGIGVNYEGFSIHEGDITQLQFKVGSGYLQRQIFQNAATGKPVEYMKKVGIFDVFHLTWSAQFAQGFGDSWVEGKDLLTAYMGFEEKYENYHDSLMLLPGGGGLPKKTDYKINIGTDKKDQPDPIDNFLSVDGKTRKSQTIYPELTGNDNLTNTLYTGLTFNYMDDKMVSNEGIVSDLKFQFAPDFMNDKSAFYSIQLNTVAGTTLYECKRPNGLNKFSIVLLDRTNISWIDGDAVPTFASHMFSLGRKMRGFDNNSFNTNFAVVNNFDIRFASPEPIWDGIFARLNLFFDVGYYSGNYLNTGKHNIKAVKDSGFLASTGFQLELDVVDSIDLGLQIARLLCDHSLRDRTSDWIVGATFFLDF